MANDSLWLYAAENLPEQHRERFAQLKATTLKTGRAWAIKESLRELWHYTRVGWAETPLEALVLLGDPLAPDAGDRDGSG